MADEEKKIGKTMFIHLYGTKTEDLNFDAFHYTAFKKSFKRNALQVGSLPPILLVIPNIYLLPTIKSYSGLKIN